MDSAHTITLRVEQINRPDDVPELECLYLRITLSHTILDLKELIWIKSEHYSLNPLFVKIKKRNGEIASDLETLAQAFGISEPTFSRAGDLSLEIDYTLLKSPAIPKRDPIPTLFDIKVTGTVRGNKKTANYRETLDSTVGGIKDQVADKFQMNREHFEFQFGAQVLEDDTTLLQALELDVPPLFCVDLTMVKTNFLQVLAQNIASNDRYSFEVNQDVTVDDVKGQIASFSSNKKESLRLYYSAHLLETPDEQPFLQTFQFPDNDQPIEILFDTENQGAMETLFDMENQRTMINGTKWSPTGETYVEIERNGEQRLVSVDAISSEVYEIDAGGSKVRLSTSELILNDGYVLLSPAGFAKLGKTWGNQVQAAQRKQAPQDHVIQPTLASPVEPIVPNVNRPAAPRDSVGLRLLNAGLANLRNLGQLVFNFGIFAVFVGLDLLRAFTQPRIMYFLLAWCFVYVFLIHGGDVSDWIDRTLLENAPLGRPDFAVASFVSQIFRTIHNGFTSATAGGSDRVIRIIVRLRRPRYEVVAQTARRQDSPGFYVAGAFREAVAGFVMFFATLVPSLHTSITEQLLSLRNSEAENIRKSMTEMLETNRLDPTMLKKAIEGRCGQLIEEILSITENDGIDDLVRCYRAVVQTTHAKTNELVEYLKVLDRASVVSEAPDEHPNQESPRESGDQALGQSDRHKHFEAVNVPQDLQELPEASQNEESTVHSIDSILYTDASGASGAEYILGLAESRNNASTSTEV